MTADHVLESGSRVGRYRVENVLGVGSHAVVYKAFDTILNRTVALKVLKPEIAADKEMFARFEREARAAANLMHPHIAWVWDIGQADGKHFLAVKYIEGISLDKVIAERTKLQWTESLQILEEISLALDFAHSKGVIHRDIKPKNILISQQEGAVLTDFGLAKVLYDTAMQTRVGMVLGSPGYIPPEIWNGDPATQATDQYALACVFYEMLCGKTLFWGGGNFNMMIREHLEGIPLRRPWPEEIPSIADQPLRKALSRNPEERYEKLSSLIRDFKGIEAKVEVDTGDYKQSPPPETESDGNKPADINTTPRDGFLPQDVTKIHVDQTVKVNWRSKLRSLISPASHKFVLRSLTPAGKEFKLDRDQLIIGRDPQCEVSLDGMGISRQHATLTRSKDGYVIKDLNSKNGTFVNGQRLSGIRALVSGDIIDLGTSARLVYNKE